MTEVLGTVAISDINGISLEGSAILFGKKFFK